MLRRAVFSDYQRKGLEKRFQVQKYISKPDRKKLAEKLGLKDSQVRGKEADSLLEHPPSESRAVSYQREIWNCHQENLLPLLRPEPEPHHLQTLIREAEKMGIVFVGCR